MYRAAVVVSSQWEIKVVVEAGVVVVVSVGAASRL